MSVAVTNYSEYLMNKNQKLKKSKSNNLNYKKQNVGIMSGTISSSFQNHTLKGIEA